MKSTDNAPLEPETVSVMFSLDELWLAQAAVRHECERMGEWKFPPASLDLNDQIAGAILACVERNEPEGPLLLSRGDTLLLDYCVPAGAKDAKGQLLGKTVLLKTFAARRDLRDGPQPVGVEPAQQTANAIKAALSSLLKGEADGNDHDTKHTD